MIWPAPLRRGDTILLVASSRRVEPAELRPFLEFARIQNWKIEYDPNTLYAKEGLLAGSDTQRLSVLQQALDDPKAKAIWFARGGYGSSRIWPLLSWEGFRAHPKWLIGFSDTTPFLWGAAKIGVVALHAPVAAYIPYRTSIQAVNQLLALLRGEENYYTLTWSYRPWLAWRVGKAEGKLLGGNLTLLQSLCGTTLDLKLWREPILLFWEEVGEYFYRLDRMSWHLRNAGWYDQSTGVMIGSLTLMREDEDFPFGRSADAIVRESVGKNIPLVMGMPIGHTQENYPVPVGAWAELEVREEGARLSLTRGTK
ncbi:MAG: LD-carboxypeptidase [Bacteroidia bacterium]|nr:LD-carboxypeptidase [Bacteroidia bacterium]MDW8235944.1 LD-carboxypeptidase [Bacteroidia bacterium]